MAMQKYAEINAKQVPILRPQMYTVMLPLLAKYGTDADVEAAFKDIIEKKYTITIRYALLSLFSIKIRSDLTKCLFQTVPFDD